MGKNGDFWLLTLAIKARMVDMTFLSFLVQHWYYWIMLLTLHARKQESIVMLGIIIS